MDFFEVTRERHSVRAFSDRLVDNKILCQILDTVNRAPSAGNLQAYEIYLVTDQARKETLVKASFDQKFLADAPVVLVFCANPARSETWYKEGGNNIYSIQDVTIACTYAMLAATALGLSSVWVGAFNESQVHQIIGSPENHIPIALLPIGYGGKPTGITPRRLLEDLVHRLDDDYSYPASS